MKVLQLAISDSGFGGANRAAYRIHRSVSDCLRPREPASNMLVFRKYVDDGSIKEYSTIWNQSWRRLLRLRLVQAAKKTFNAPEDVFFSIGWPATGLGAKLADLFQNYQFRILHFHAIDNALLSIEEIGRLRIPIVWTLHDQWAFSGCDHYSGEDEAFVHGYAAASRACRTSSLRLNRWVWQRKRKAWKRPMTLVAPSRWMADCARRSALMGSWPISVIPNPIDTTAWAPVERHTARALLNLPQDCPLVLFGASGGMADRRKGGDLLWAALQILRQRCSQTDRDTFSASPGARDLNSLRLVTFGQAGHEPGFMPPFPVHELGRISDELHLRLVYAASDLLVIPSRQDNLPNTGLEAHACGIPVVAFRTCGLVDIVDHQITGALAEPFDPTSLAEAIQWVLEDPMRQQRLGRAARQRAETLWSPRVVAKQYCDLYQQVIERHQHEVAR